MSTGANLPPNTPAIMYFGGPRYRSLSSPLLPTGNFTVSLRVQTKTGGPLLYMGPQTFGNATNNAIQVSLLAGGIHVSFAGSVVEYTQKAGQAINLLDNAVHYIALTVLQRDDTGHTIVGVFIDGMQAEHLVKNDGAAGQQLNLPNAPTLYIGTLPPKSNNQFEGVSESTFFKGTITHVYMWADLLNAADLVLQATTETPQQPENLCLAVPMDTARYDFALNAYTGLTPGKLNIQNTVTPDDTYCVGMQNYFAQFPTTSRTLETWIRCGTDATGTTLFNYGDHSNTDNPNDGGDPWKLSNPGNLTINSNKTGIDVTDGQWHHIAVVSEPSGNYIKESFYKDGVFITSVNNSGTNIVAPDHCVVGGRYVTDANDEVFQGQLYNFRIWNVARSAADIAASFNNGAFDANAAKASGLVANWAFTEGDTTSFPPLSLSTPRYQTVVTALANSTSLVPVEVPLVIAESEWMLNQKHALVMEPQAAFVVNPAGIDGKAIFFSIGSDGELYLLMEGDGTPTGWHSANLRWMFKTVLPPYTFKTFQAFGGMGDMVILLVVLSTPAGDKLAKLRLPYSTITSLLGVNPPFTPVDQMELALPFAFDGDGLTPEQVVINDLCIVGGSDDLYAVVDLDTPAAGKPVSRYFIALSGQQRRTWNYFDLPVNFEEIQINKSGMLFTGSPAGVFTLGLADGNTTLVFDYVDKFFNNHMQPVTLNLAGAVDTSIRNGHFAIANYNVAGGALVFVAGGNGLFFWGPGQQANNNPPVKLRVSGDHFYDVEKLDIFVGESTLYLWGLNAKGAVFFTYCPLNNITGNNWADATVPLMLNVSNAEAYITPWPGSDILHLYASTVKDGAAIMMHLSRAKGATAWQTNTVLLPPLSLDAFVDMQTYTTHVTVIDGTNLPKALFEVSISSASLVNVFINDIYVSLSPLVPYTTQMDYNGQLTIIQEAPALSAIGYTITPKGGDPAIINPMEKILAKLSLIRNGADVRSITIKEDDGSSAPLFDPQKLNTQTTDSLAGMIGQMTGASGGMPADGSKTGPAKKMASRSMVLNSTPQVLWALEFSGGQMNYVSGPAAAALLHNGDLHAAGQMRMVEEDGSGSFIDDVGQFFSWLVSKLKQGLDALQKVVMTVVNGVLNVVFTVLGKVFNFILDCLSSVVSVFFGILSYLGITTERITKWLGYLFNWDDILSAHKVLKNFFRQYLTAERDALKNTYTPQILAQLQKIRTDFATFTGIDTKLPPKYGASTIGGANANNTSNPGQNSPQFNWGVNHLKGNAANGNSGGNDVNVVNSLQAALNAWGSGFDGMVNAFADVRTSIQTQVIDQFSSLSIVQVITKLMGIIGDKLLQIATDMIAGLLALASTMLGYMFEYLDTPLNIPVISPFYKNTITKGQSELTMLDLACLVGAVPLTVMFKLMGVNSVFAKGPVADQLINAPDFATIKRIINGPATNVRTAAAAPSVYAQMTLAGGVMGLIGAIAGSALTAIKKAESMVNQQSFNYSVIERVISGCIAVNNLLYLMPGIIGGVKDVQDKKWYAIMNSTLTGVYGLKGITDGIISVKSLAKNEKWDFGSPVADGVLNGIWLVPTIAPLFYAENANVVGFFTALGGLGFDASGIMSPVINAAPKASVANLLIANGFVNVLYGGFTLAAAIIYYNQDQG